MHWSVGVALMHAMLLGSDPAANSVLTASPTRARLVFSEPIEPSLTMIAVVDGQGHAIRLTPANDPRDVHAIVAPISNLSKGAYRIAWRIVSADGHPVDGSFVFRVADSSAVAPSEADALAALDQSGEVAKVAGGSPIAAVLRGASAICGLVAVGLLLFGSLARGAESDERQARWTRIAILVWPIMSALHFAAWILHASPAHRLDSASIAQTVSTTIGHGEVASLILALLAAWALLLVQRPWLALVCGAASLIAGSAFGHSVAIHPEWGIPARALHLLAAAAWIGGVLWLVLSDRSDAGAFVNAASRVSGVALLAALGVVLSGVIMARLFVPSWSALIDTGYGRILLGKVAGLLVLLAFGAHHRYRVLPTLQDRASRDGFSRTLRAEVATMLVVALLGGILAYVSPTLMGMPT